MEDELYPTDQFAYEAGLNLLKDLQSPSAFSFRVASSNSTVSTVTASLSASDSNSGASFEGKEGPQIATSASPQSSLSPQNREASAG